MAYGLPRLRRKLASKPKGKKSKSKVELVYRCPICSRTVTIYVPVLEPPRHKGDHPGKPKEMKLVSAKGTPTS